MTKIQKAAGNVQTAKWVSLADEGCTHVKRVMTARLREAVVEQASGGLWYWAVYCYLPGVDQFGTHVARSRYAMLAAEGCCDELAAAMDEADEALWNI
jgi:hypothetical protein